MELIARSEHCNFADDKSLHLHTQKDIQEKKTRHKIHSDKTKVMKVKNKSKLKTKVRGADLEEVQDFKYLGTHKATLKTRSQPE